MKTHAFYASGENTTDFLTSKDEGHLHHAELANLAAMAGSILHQVGATEVVHPELTTLVNFNGTNGYYPTGLFADAHGDLFGTTIGGGTNGYGTVFEITKTGHGYASSPTTLVDFNGTNGSQPTGSLIADAHGDLFGTTFAGGPNGYGTVFEIVNTAHGYASTPTTLVSFNGANGAGPAAGLIANAHGDLFGTTSGSVPSGDGTVFEIAGSGFDTHKTLSCSVLESHDSFVFAPNLGENTGLNSNVHDKTIDHPKSEFAQLTELTQSHQDAANLAHDGSDIMDHAAALTAQHAHHFLV
jgi:uncharacterized repeat protein (TIGR03803 family)